MKDVGMEEWVKDTKGKRMNVFESNKETKCTQQRYCQLNPYVSYAGNICHCDDSLLRTSLKVARSF